MKDKGLVLSTQDHLAKVEVECFTACGDCSAQSLCLGQSASKGYVSAKNPLLAQPGDTVSLNIPEAMYNKSLILVFGTFLVSALLGMALGHFSSLVLSIPTPESGILGLFLGLIAAGIWLFRFFQKKNNI